MLLKEFPNIVLDELPQRPDPKKIYFLSKPLYNTAQYNDDNPINIYTTKTIRKFLMSGHNKISGHFIVPFNDAKLVPDKEEIRVHTIHTGSACGNVMFIFEYIAKPNEKTLYTGQFNENGDIYHDVYLKAAQKNSQIANVYIDNTLASAVTENSVSNAAKAIRDICHGNPRHKVYLNGERLGCENLLNILSTKYNLKVFPNLSRLLLFHALRIADRFCHNKDAADIIVTEDGPSFRQHTYQAAYKDKKIWLRLITAEKETKPIGDVADGIVYIPYAPHPSAEMLMLLLERLKPKKVVTMTEKYSSGSCSNIPESMRYAFEIEYGNIDTVFESGEGIDYAKLNGNVDEDAQTPDPERSFLATSDDNSASSGDEQVFHSAENERTPELPEDNFHDAPESNVANCPSSPIVSIADEVEQNGNCNIIEVAQVKPKANEEVITTDHQSSRALKRKGAEIAPTPKASANTRTNEKTPIREPQTIYEPQEVPAAVSAEHENGRGIANQLNNSITVITISDDNDEPAQKQQRDRNGNTIEVSQIAPKAAEKVMRIYARRPKKVLRKMPEIVETRRTTKVDGRKQLKGIEYISSSSTESEMSDAPCADRISIESLSIHSSPSSDN